MSKFDSYFGEMQKNQIDALKKALMMKDNEGRTPVHKATFGMEGQQSVGDLLWYVKDQPDFLKELLCVQDNKGRTPLHMAAWWGRQQAVNELLQYIKTQPNFLQELLLIQDENGSTPLHVAAQNDREPIISLLLDGVKDQSDFLKKLFLTKDKLGRTLLHKAATTAESIGELLKYVEGQPELLEELLLMQDETGKTPLHIAAQFGAKVEVEIFLENGANSNAKDKEGKTPRALAEQRDYVAVASLLKKYEESAVTVVPTSGSDFNITQEGHEKSLALISSQKARRSVREVVPHELKYSAIHKPCLEKNEQIQLSQKELISKPSISYSMDRCTLGVRYGQSYVEGITCSTKDMKMMVFLKDSHIKLDRSEDIYFRERCSPIEFNGRLSVYCEGQKTNVVYTPEITQQHPLERLNEQLMLFYVVLHEGKKTYRWLQDFFREKNNQAVSSNKSQIADITTQQKASWEKSLIDIETRLKDIKDINKGKGELHWVGYILEDRKQEFEDLIRRPQASLEEVNTFAENLQALQAELEIIESPALISSRINQDSSVRKIESVDTAKQNPLTSVAALSAQKEVTQPLSKARFAIWNDQSFFKARQQPLSTFIPATSATNTSIAISGR